jgi:hypothetical protein
MPTSPPIHEGETFTFLDALATLYESPYEFYRTTYKYTDCGPSVGLRIVSDPVAGTLFGREGFGEWVYCDDLHRFGTFAAMSEAGMEVTGLRVSSIVEGTDAEVPARTLEDAKVFVDAEAFWAAWYTLVGGINAEADEIWMQTHGCEGCVVLWHADGVDTEAMSAEYGGIVVRDECPICGGKGEVI